MTQLGEDDVDTILVDGTQAVGKIPVSVRQAGMDAMSFAAHKFHGPKGAGFLYVRRRDRVTRIDPLVYGGGQERGMRSGTLDVPRNRLVVFGGTGSGRAGSTVSRPPR